MAAPDAASEVKAHTPRPSEPEPPRPRGHQFSEDRATGDAVVKKATVGRIRQALTSTFGSFDELPVRGFDLACAERVHQSGPQEGFRRISGRRQTCWLSQA